MVGCEAIHDIWIGSRMRVGFHVHPTELIESKMLWCKSVKGSVIIVTGTPELSNQLGSETHLFISCERWQRFERWWLMGASLRPTVSMTIGCAEAPQC
jgi:hypothetical protein